MKYKKMLLPIISATLIFFMLFTQFQVYAYEAEDVFNEDFDIEILGRMTSAHLPTISVSVFTEEGTVFEKGYGDQPDLSTVYPLYSLNKPLLSLAILKLVEDNLIDLEEDINAYLDYSIRNPDYPSTPIKVKYLLSHPCGSFRAS